MIFGEKNLMGGTSKREDEIQNELAAPIRYGMKVRVQAKLADVLHRVKFVYTMTDAKSGRRLAIGHTVQAAVHAKSGELCLMTPRSFLRHL
jgi:acyl-CoA thioester hydrolase